MKLTAALALVLLFSVPAAAQTPAGEVPVTTPVAAGAWTVTPFLSFTFGGNGDSSSLGLGGALGYDFTDLLSVEGELAYVFDLIGDDEAADWSVLSLGGNVLYHFPLANGMAPYATAGLGLARSNLRIADINSDTAEVGFNFGGGIKAPLTGKFSARGDIRYFKYIDEGPDGWRIYGGVTWRVR